MGLDFNTLINLGGVGLLCWLVRMAYDTRGDVRVIKSKLGMNGSTGGLIQDVADLRKVKHDQANQIATLNLDVALLKQAKEP